MGGDTAGIYMLPTIARFISTYIRNDCVSNVGLICTKQEDYEITGGLLWLNLHLTVQYTGALRKQTPHETA